MSVARQRGLSRSQAQRAQRVVVPAIVLVLLIAMLVPVYYMVVVAASREGSSLSNLWFHDFDPAGNIGTVLGDGFFPRYLLNSVLVCSGIATLDVALSASAGYALAHLSFVGRRLIFALVVGILALSPIVVIIPVYVMLFHIGWLDSYQGLIVPSMVSAFGVFLVRQFALGIPRNLIDAARLDRASEFRIFVQIVFPLLRPALLTLFLLQFLNQWDNLIWPLIVVSRQDLWTVPVGLAGFTGEHGVSYHLLTTGALLSAIPPLILFVALQRYYVSGLTLGGLKG